MKADKRIINKMIDAIGEENVETIYGHFFGDYPYYFFSMYFEYGDNDWLYDVMEKVWLGDFFEDYNDLDTCRYYVENSIVETYNQVNVDGRAYLTNPIWGYMDDLDESLCNLFDYDDDVTEPVMNIDGYDRVISNWYVLGIADAIREIFKDRAEELAKEHGFELEYSVVNA